MNRSCRTYILWKAVLLLVVLTMFSGCRGEIVEKKSSKEKASPPLVRSMTVKAEERVPSEVYSGEVHNRLEVRLAFRVPGKIIERYVDSGSVVREGDLLMKIDPSDIQQAVSAGKAQVEAARSQYKLAGDQLARFETLYGEDLMSRAELDRYQNAHDSAKALLTQATAQFTHSQNQLSYCDLKADSQGVVLMILAESGQVVAAGQPVVIVAKESELEIEISVPESRIDSFGEGGIFKVTFWALPGVELDGRVRVVSPVADMITRTYTARITLVDPPQSVKLGMTASVSRSSLRSGDDLHIPLSAVYQTGEKPMVWVISQNVAEQDSARKDVVQKDAAEKDVSRKDVTQKDIEQKDNLQSYTVQLREVRLGDPEGSDQVRVLGGLVSGERIVTAGVHKLRNGEKVWVGEEKP